MGGKGFKGAREYNTLRAFVFSLFPPLRTPATLARVALAKETKRKSDNRAFQYLVRIITNHTASTLTRPTGRAFLQIKVLLTYLYICLFIYLVIYLFIFYFLAEKSILNV